MNSTKLLEKFNKRINQAVAVYDNTNIVIKLLVKFVFDDAKRILADIVKNEDIVSEEDDLK